MQHSWNDRDWDSVVAEARALLEDESRIVTSGASNSIEYWTARVAFDLAVYRCTRLDKEEQLTDAIIKMVKEDDKRREEFFTRHNRRYYRNPSV